MKRFYMGRIVCANQHCLLALVVESANPDQADELQRVMRDAEIRWGKLLSAGVIRPQCRLCRSTDLAAEAGVMLNCQSIEDAKRFAVESYAGFRFHQNAHLN